MSADTWTEIVDTLRSEFSDLPDAAQITRIAVRLLLAALLGGILGYEREHHGKAAGIRTHMLVSLGAALFVLVPLFALLLKLFYLDSGRLYLEHLVVAFYSHAFLCLALLAQFALLALDHWVTPHLAFFGAITGLAAALLWLWMPTYLLLMQKRRLQLERTRYDGEIAWLEFVGQRGEGPFEVRDQQLTGAEIAELQGTLSRHLGAAA